MVAPSSHHCDIAALRRVTILRSLDDYSLAPLAALARRHAYHGGAALARPAAPRTTAYAVVDGGVRLARSSPAPRPRVTRSM